ncbi:coiled-coil domain-containing protein 144A-like [Manis javanica]|uniref:coiled-coil domain-containing protein 144A-like n=1 Tax=Manis javanica TaxID=9974 RepID=UPI003C6CDED6
MMSKKERPDGSDYNHQQDKIAMLKPETQAMKNQKEKKYLEDTEIIKEKDDLQKKTVIKETSTKVMFQYGGRLDFLTSENTMLHSKLQNEKASKERLETEVVSDNSRLSTATRDHEQSQASERELGFAFHSLRARNEWFLSSQEENMSILSQQLSKAERKVSSLEIELSHTRDALREKTLDLESVQTDLSHIPCQKKNSEHKYENKQDKLNKYIRKQEFLENRLSQLQSENELLRQRLNTVLVRHKLQQQWADVEIQRFESESLLEAASYYTNERQDLKKKLNQALSQVVDLSRKLELSSSEVRNLKTHMARMSLEHSKMEQYRRDNEERARPKAVEKLKEVDWFLQDESQKRLQQWREKDNSSFRMQMEFRIKDLELQLSKKISQEDSIRAELEKYKQLHQEEVNTTLSLAKQLDKITVKLAEISSKHREKEMDTFFAKKVMNQKLSLKTGSSLYYSCLQADILKSLCPYAVERDFVVIVQIEK